MSVACSCLSGGYPCARRMRFTIARIFARTLSLTVQSIEAFFLTASTSSNAICLNVSSPSTKLLPGHVA